jgi:hypothetical protein
MHTVWKSVLSPKPQSTDKTTQLLFQMGTTGSTYHDLYTQNYWVSGLCPSSGIINNYNAQRFENWICFRLQVRGKETPTLLGPLERANLQFAVSKGSNTIDASLPLPEDGNRTSFRNDIFSSIQNSERWPKSRNPAILINSECFPASSESFRFYELYSRSSYRPNRFCCGVAFNPHFRMGKAFWEHGHRILSICNRPAPSGLPRVQSTEHLISGQLKSIYFPRRGRRHMTFETNNQRITTCLIC